MKKSIALILALVMALSLFAGCGSSDKAPETTVAPEAGSNENVAQDVQEEVVAGIGERVLT